MATRISPSQNKTYYINPAYLTFVENSGYGVNYIQVSASSSCYITVYDPDNGIRYNVESGYRKWKITAYNNRFPDDKPEYLEPWNIYVRLERNGSSALVVYDQKERAISGGIITVDEEGKNTVGEADPDYYYIHIGSVGETDGVSVIRQISYDTGYLDTPESQNSAWDLLDAMFVPHYDDPNNPNKISWIEAKAHMGILGGVTMFLDGENIDRDSIYDGLPIDMDTIQWELDENGKKLYLKAKGGEGNGTIGEIEILGEGNAITKVEVVKGGEGEADTLVFTKEKTFIDKETLEKDYLTKAYIEENYYTKTNVDETFFKKEEASGLFVTLDETTQEILGVKTFKNGLNIGSSKIWQSQDGIIRIDADVVISGGLTMYGVDNVDVSTIMDGVAVDGVTITKRNGYLEVIGGGGGSIEYPLTWSGFSSGSYDGTSAKSIYIPSKLSEFTNDENYAKTSDLSNYLPLTGGTLTGDLTLCSTGTTYGNTLSFGDEGYTYLTEDSDDHLSVYARAGIDLSCGSGYNVNVKTNLHVAGSLYVKGSRFCTPKGSDNRGFAFGGQYMRVHWDYESFETILHLDGNNVVVFAKTPQITGGIYLADRSWVKQNCVSGLGLEKDSSGAFNQYLTYTKNGVVNKISVGYAGYATGLKAWSTSDLSDSGVWNTVIGMRSSFFASSASNKPMAAGNNANGLITFMPTNNYGFQVAYLNQLSTGYESIPHLFFRNYVNGSYKSWYRIVTNGPQMGFDGINWSAPYMRLRYQDGSWYYVQMHSDGMWLGLSNTNGVRVDGSGNLLTTGGITMYGTSDQRLKQNIRTFSASKELMNLGGVYEFEYVDGEVKRNERYQGTHYGLIYQNVKDSSLSKMCYEREDGFGVLNYLDTSFISLLAAVGMEHETRLQKLERENKELRVEVEQLKSK